MTDMVTAFPAEERVVTLHITNSEGVKSELPVTVRRFKTGQLPKILKSLGPISEGLKGLAAKDRNFDPTLIFVDKPEECMNFVAAACGVSRVTLDESDVDDAVELFTTVLEVNLPFFVKVVIPKFVGALKRLRDVWIARSDALLGSVAGEMQSTSSSPADTAATPT